MTDHQARKDAALRLTVAGSFGYGNAGDEGAPLAVADLAQSLGYIIHVDVLSRYDEPASRGAVIGLQAVDVDRRIAIANQPLLFVGGGIIEPSVESSLSSIARWMHYAGVQYATLFGASVEPGRRFGWAARRRLSAEARSLRHLFVRDLLSQQVLSALSPDRSVEAIGDVLMYLEPSADPPAPIRELRGARYIAVNCAPRWINDAGWRPWLVKHLHATAKRLDAAIVFVPCTQEHDSDQIEHEAITQLLRDSGFDRPIVNLGYGHGPREILASFGGAVLTIGMRLHACLMSYSRGVPFVALAYHPKLSGFAMTVEQPDRVLPRDLPATQAAQMYGYEFSALNLADCDLERAALEAVESSSFHMREPLRLRLAHALSTVIQDVAPAPAPIAEGVTG